MGPEIVTTAPAKLTELNRDKRHQLQLEKNRDAIAATTGTSLQVAYSATSFGYQEDNHLYNQLFAQFSGRMRSLKKSHLPVRNW